MIQHFLLVFNGSPTITSSVSPANLLNAASESDGMSELLERRPAAARVCARCFFNSANVPALIVTETCIFILPSLSVV